MSSYRKFTLANHCNRAVVQIFLIACGAHALYIATKSLFNFSHGTHADIVSIDCAAFGQGVIFIEATGVVGQL
jgi:hypothetical protein